ncbi:hypothetical protein CCE02nite_07970 [Cellulosimicrobium cellulans]|uniref:Uncharacterized protein n=1 Tax=Cellulosimicrobium cellulans TaxID=1710 RepID=A0A4Y4DZM2_CELCE|nr:hypothetical protein CCE02nite_07970 [Cellulosimicrobium cellulans]
MPATTECAKATRRPTRSTARRRAPLFGPTFMLIGVGLTVPAFDPFWAMLRAVVKLAVYGLARGDPVWGRRCRQGRWLVVEGVAVAVALLGQAWAGLVVGAVLLARAAGDAHHLHTGRFVAASPGNFLLRARRRARSERRRAGTRSLNPRVAGTPSARDGGRP